MSGLAQHGHEWAKAGWGVFPLPAGQKSPPAKGWTGRGAPYPSGADVQAWIEEEPDANMGLRFPAGVVGIDVDQYGDKHGLATLVACSKTWGKLPPAPRITSRPETRSGIYLYRLPDDVSSDRFMGELPGGNVEILRPEHRYAVGPGSLHPEGRVYLLVHPDGCFEEDGVAIRREGLPELPMAWVEGLTLNEKAAAGPEVELVGGRGDAYVQSALDHIARELKDIATWPEKKVDEKGRGWEKIQADAAFRLASLALADWNSLTIEQAMRHFGDHAPIGGGWTSIDVASKWRSQMKRAEPAEQPKTQSDDPLAPGYQPPDTPAMDAFESAVGADPAAAPVQGADFLVPEPEKAPAAPEGIAADWVKHSWDDMGNAQRVIELFGPRLRYISLTDRWMAYDEETGTWEESKLAGARAVMQMIDQLPRLEAHLYSNKKPPATGKKEPTSPREDFYEWVKSQRFDSRYRAAANVLKATGVLNESPTSFDAHPMLLNCRNGVVDLRTGELLAHDPVLKLRKQIPVDYDPKAVPKRWLDYVEHAHPAADLRAYLQRIAGYSLTGSTNEQVFFIHQGPPNTGKSVFINVMSALLGELARVIPATTLMSKRNEGHPTEIMGLAGRRLLTMSESAEGARLDAALVKRLSGSDIITARGMGQDFQDFKLVGKIHLVTNHLPHIPDDPALQRRIHVMPWNVVIESHEIDYELEEDILREELSGVLTWAVQGALAWQRGRLARPPAAHLAALDYFEEEDEFGDFLTEKLAETQVTWTKTSALYQLYSRWCDSNNIRPMSKVAFGRKMVQRKFVPVKSNGERGFRCTLKADPILADPLAP